MELMISGSGFAQELVAFDVGGDAYGDEEVCDLLVEGAVPADGLTLHGARMDGGHVVFLREVVESAEQQPEVEGLCKEIFRAVAQRLLHESVGVELAHHDDGRSGFGERGEHTETVELGHDDVEKEKVRVEFFDGGKRFFAVFGDCDYVIIVHGSEKFFQIGDENGVVVGNNNGFFHHILQNFVILFYHGQIS